MRMEEHRRDQEAEAVVALMVTSDTRTPETDETGKMAIQLLEGAGHKVAGYVIVENDADRIMDAFQGFLDEEEIDVIITSGGTGIGSKDMTVDAVSDSFDKTVVGFGELFRRLSYDEIGEASMFSRATAGVARGKLIFCLPGSKGAVRTALSKIIIPALGHMLWEVKR